MTEFARRLVVPLLLFCVLAAAAIVMSRTDSIGWLIGNEQVLRGRIAEAPASAWFVGLSVYFCVSMIPGTTGKSIVAGWFFGLLPGILIVEVALTLAACVSFLLARNFGQSMIQSRFPGILTQLQQRLDTESGYRLLILRMAHVPFTLMNYGTGAGTNVPLPTFAWSTLIGLLPGTIVCVYAGSELPTLQQLADEGPLLLIDPVLLLALMATVLIPFIVRRALLVVAYLRRRFRSALK